MKEDRIEICRDALETSKTLSSYVWLLELDVNRRHMTQEQKGMLLEVTQEMEKVEQLLLKLKTDIEKDERPDELLPGQWL